MQAHHTKAILDSNGNLHIEALPFSAGESVEVIVFPSTDHSKNGNAYPLHGTPISYANPFEPVSEADWESAL
jgi:hypothetical protein